MTLETQQKIDYEIPSFFDISEIRERLLLLLNVVFTKSERINIIWKILRKFMTTKYKSITINSIIRVSGYLLNLKGIVNFNFIFRC